MAMPTWAETLMGVEEAEEASWEVVVVILDAIRTDSQESTVKMIRPFKGEAGRKQDMLCYGV